MKSKCALFYKINSIFHKTMALPPSHYQAFTPQEIEFLAEATLVTIIPNTRIDALELISV